jgi:putative transposase
MLHAVAAEFPRYGAEMCYDMIKREHLRPEHGRVNHKRVERLYRLHGLQVRRRKRKRIAQHERRPHTVPTAPNEHWSMDFTSDQLRSGQRFRTLNVMDVFTRECLEIEAATSLPGSRVVDVLNRIIADRAAPKQITVDNGPEFVSRALDTWAYDHSVHLNFIRPGKPIENAFIESFNGKFRNECLNQHYFKDINDARNRIADWRDIHNHRRPHRGLGKKTPGEFHAMYLNRSAAAPSDNALSTFRHYTARPSGGRPMSKAGASSEAATSLDQCDEPITTTINRL